MHAPVADAQPSVVPTGDLRSSVPILLLDRPVLASEQLELRRVLAQQRTIDPVPVGIDDGARIASDTESNVVSRSLMAQVYGKCFSQPYHSIAPCGCSLWLLPVAAPCGCSLGRFAAQQYRCRHTRGKTARFLEQARTACPWHRGCCNRWQRTPTGFVLRRCTIRSGVPLEQPPHWRPTTQVQGENILPDLALYSGDACTQAMRSADAWAARLSGRFAVDELQNAR
jgi:hypothetical protein